MRVPWPRGTVGYATPLHWSRIADQSDQGVCNKELCISKTFLTTLATMASSAWPNGEIPYKEHHASTCALSSLNFFPFEWILFHYSLLAGGKEEGE